MITNNILIMRMLKKYILMVMALSCLTAVVSAQNNPVQDYFAEAGDYSAVYTGKVKPLYYKTYYDNTPYWHYDFARADVVYNGIKYPDRQVILDLFYEQAIIKSPDKNYDIILEPDKTDSVRFLTLNATFIWLDPTEKALKKGFYRLMYDGDSIRLLCKEKFESNQSGRKQHFFMKKNYYVYMGGAYLPVKNRRSLSGLFPGYRKQIDRHYKQIKKDADSKEEVLTGLATYCDELLKKGG